MHVSSSVCKFIMATFGFLVIAAVTAGLVIGLSGQEVKRSFTVDHEANTFLMNGEPFRYISGSFHYFRALPGAWRERLRTMRASGLNALDTYVEWALHNPNDGVYNWDGLANLEQFIEMVQEEGFFIILRPGPYICAERDNGGLPHWLFNKYPNIKMRTNDSNYTREVSLWYSQMMPRMQKYLYGNGGPIIMVQVENEYGSFHACDKDYLNWLRDETERYVQGQAVLFTTDIPNERIACGKIENVFATTDFGIDRIHEIDDIWNILRTVQPTGPLVNSEFYPGWLTHWQEENQRRDPNEVASALRKILEYGASVNIYMFFGGTNFGFTAGANDFGSNDYTADITSYDYDAVMDEQGDTTTKYELVRDVISNYLNVSKDISTPTKSLKIAYGKVEMKPLVTLMSAVGREILSPGNPIVSEKPKTFEELNQFSGLVLYETILPTLEIDPTLMTVGELRDRAYIFVDQFLVGTLSRENNIKKIPLNSGLGVKLQLLVENQGRINYNIANDTKGILGDVTIQKLDGNQTVLRNWNSTSFSLKDEHIESLIKKYKNSEFVTEKDAISSRNILSQGPVIYYGEFTVSEIADSFLNTENWGKGVAYLNGFNLGRYWPLVGPQLTLYAPKELMQIGTNTLVLIEYQRVADISNDGTSDIYFDASPKLDGFK